MANILGLALKISADSTQLKLTPAERALQTLGAEAAKLTSVFEQFTGESTAAATAQQKFATDLAFLNSALKTGQITAQQYAEEFANLAQASEQEATALREAARITESVRTPFERFQRTAGELSVQLEAGRISQETYNRAVEQASKGLTDAERAAAGLAVQDRAIEEAAAAAAAAESARVEALRRGAAITASLQTDEERRAARLSELDDLLRAGAISEETYTRAVEQASGVQEAAARAEQERQRVLEEGRRITQQFATVEERRADELANLDRLLAAGAISQETYSRASAEASGANEAAARAERERADATAAANRIIQAGITPQERYDAAIVELRGHLEAGRLSQDQFNRATERARQDLDRTTTSARANDQALQGISRQLTVISRLQIGRAIVDGFQLLGGAIRSATGQISGFVSSVSTSLDTLNDLSNRIDVPVQQLQGLGLAAKLSGVDTEQFATAVTRLGVSIGKADPGGTFDKTLRSVGVSLAEIRGLRPEQQFEQISAAIGALPTSADRAAAAVEIFGKQGAALTPLFKEGAASVEELTARAERLGIIVSEDQVSNIAEMNDAFDLVSATVEGIIGQVTGNLAPVVTAIADEFLSFVESFSNADGGGGTAIADAITDVLLNGAEFLAGVFDSFVSQFGGLSSVLVDAGAVFQATGEVFTIVYEGLRVIFNAFEIAGNSLALALGKALEAIGSYLNSDLEAFGKDLVAASQASIDQNAKELLDAASGVADATERLLTGADAEKAAAGPAEQFIEGMRSRIEQARSPEFKVTTNIEKTREAFDEFFGGIVDESSRVTGLMREFEAAVADAQADATLTADEIARINELQGGVNAAIQQELALRSEAAASAREQADADSKRIDSLLKTTDATQKIIDDLSAVEREIARVQQEIAETGTGDSGAAQGRLEELRALQGQLDEQLRAAAQGFEGGFQKAFEATGQNFNRLAEQAQQFGQAGFDAAARLQEGIAAAQEQAQDGILNREAYEAEVARQQQLFEQEVANVKAVADERQRVNNAVDQAVNLARFGGDQQRLAAAQRVAEFEREIIRVQQEVQTARAAGDQVAVNAGVQRLGLLDQVAAKERDVASGRQQFEQQIAQQREQYLQALNEQQKKAEEEQKKFAEERAKAIEAENQRQAARIRELNTLGSGVIQGNDLRTSEGAALFLNLAANRQDPALIEARLQTKALQGLRQQVTQLVEGLTGLPTVRIPGALG
jgi:hypothetical protein